MALSNRDRIGQMFDILSPALNQFITETTAPGLPQGASAWTVVMQTVDNTSGSAAHDYNPLDPQIQLKLLSQNYTGRYRRGWQPFRGTLTRVHEAYAGELLDHRNAWAHHKPFTDDDAYRALDTAERLLKSISAGSAADQVAKIRKDLRRVAVNKGDKKPDLPTTGSPHLRPWREVLRPHDDVATGNFQASEFAADLYKVATGDPGEGRDYADPTEFFARTYLTEGLRDLVGRAVRRLSGDDNASPVINLQTNFGGGKTHSMLCLWHLASGLPAGSFPQEWQELLQDAGYHKVPRSVRRVAIVGNHFAPSGETKPDGTRINTVWGELAWQLGGAQGYALVADADRTSTPPGRALHTLLETYGPAVILIDEWVAYARSLVGREGVAGGTFDDQFTFAQSLTEATKATSGLLLAISIPASESNDDCAVAGNAEEVGGSNGLEALRRLQNVVRRVADQWRPASPKEAYHIVRQRLFVTPDADAITTINTTARAFVDYYRKNGGEFPIDARDGDYETRIRQTFPIHPELFDRLYEDWSTLERFQRTRGVLRLMNTVIHALWQGNDAAPLIMPGSIPLDNAVVNAELTQYLQDSWRAIIDADVDGPNSEPSRIDQGTPLYGQRSLTRRLARTVFFGAAPTIGAAQKGVETQRVFLGTAIPGDVPGNFHSALTKLADRATHFYASGGKFWYDVQANITRRARDQAERLHAEEVWAEIVRRLESQASKSGDFARVHVCPAEGGDIPDLDEARLVITHPRLAHSRNASDSSALTFAQHATAHRGSANRTHRNMLVYLAADAARMTELEAAVRNYLGWSGVLADATALDLTENQRNQAADKKTQEGQTVDSRLLGTYQWALVPIQPVPAEPFTVKPFKAESPSPWLAERVSRRLGNDGNLSTQQAAAAIRHALDTLVPKVWESGHVRVGDLWAIYADYPYMSRLRDESVLIDGLSVQPLLWEQEGFALADDYDENTDRYRGLVLPGEAGGRPTNRTLIVKPARAKAQRVDPPPPPPLPPLPPKPDPMPARYFGAKELSTDRYAMDFKSLADAVLNHLIRPDINLSVRIEIEAVADDGFDRDTIRTVSENSRTLHFDQSEFEDH